MGNSKWQNKILIHTKETSKWVKYIELKGLPNNELYTYELCLEENNVTGLESKIEGKTVYVVKTAMDGTIFIGTAKNLIIFHLMKMMVLLKQSNLESAD